MPQEPPTGALSSAFPPPPTYYTHFTEENLAALKSHHLEDGTLPPADSLPDPLCYLVPPPPPAGSYRAFGEEWMVPERYPSLEEAGIRQLYPPTSMPAVAAANGGGGGSADKGKELTVDRTIELRRLSKSLLLNYLELVGVMGMAPEQFHEKTADLETILFNMHHLINEYRPHQARETLCLRMEEQLERTRRETEENKKAVAKVEDVLAGLELVAKRADALCGGDGLEAGNLGDMMKDKVDDDGVAKARVRDMEAWETLVGMGG